MSDRRRRVADRDPTGRQNERSDPPGRFALMRVRASGLRRSRALVRTVRLPGPPATVGRPGAKHPNRRPAPRRRVSFVIPGLARSGPAMRRVPEWPEEMQAQARTPRPLFEARPPLRKLIVVSDADLLAVPDDVSVTPAALLTGLLTHPYIKLLRYRDEGPAAGLARDGEPPRGWACLLPQDGDDGRGLVCAHDSGGWTYTSVSSAVAAYARGDTGSGVYGDRPPEAAVGQRELDALAAGVAAAIEADLFITGRPYLFGTRKIHIPSVTLCRIPEALAMVGLYLRSQGEFVLWRAADGSGGPTAIEWLYYQIGAIALLPELWRWSGIQAAAAQQEAPDALGGLTGALLLLVRALRTRDSFHRAFNLPQQRDAVRTVLVELDTILVMLMGAVDASARFIHVLLAVQGEQRDAGWQKSGWRSKLVGQSQPLADLFGNGAPLADVLTVLSRLRKTVHGQAIQATMRQSGRIRDAPITLPAEHESRILASMDNLGGRAAWGARPGVSGAVAVDPGQFVGQLFPAVLGLLNTVMAATPSAYVLGQRPGPDAGPRWYSERSRLSVRWQLGF